MSITRNNKILITVLALFALSLQNVKATEECFENTSRAIFKFNMAFDDLVFEPLAKGYNKLPDPIKRY